MKLIKFDLPIDGVKVKDLEELCDHFTPEILAHYRSGILAKWLMTRKCQDELAALKSLEDGDDHTLLKGLCHVFQIDADDRVIAEALREFQPNLPAATSSRESHRLKFALSLDGERVSRLDDLRTHFTVEILDHHRSGLLSEWLHSHGLRQELVAVNALENLDDHALVKSLSRIFAVDADDRLIAEALKEGMQPMQLQPCPGTTWVESLTGMAFVWIPSGCWSAKKKFIDVNDKSDDCIPVRMRGFWLSQQPITKDQRNFLMEENCELENGRTSFYENSEFSDRQKFIGILSARNPSKSRFRLPCISELIYAMNEGADFIDANLVKPSQFVKEFRFKNSSINYLEFTMEGELVGFEQGDFFIANERKGSFCTLFGDDFQGGGEANLFRIIREA